MQIPEHCLQRPPDVGSFDPDRPDLCVAAWLPDADHDGFASVSRMSSKCPRDIRNLVGDVQDYTQLWDAAPVLHHLLGRLGYSYGRTTTAWHVKFPGADRLNYGLRELKLPKGHAVPRFAAFDGGEFKAHDQIAELAGENGGFLMATKSEAAVHDVLNHAIVQFLLAPGHMRFLHERAQAASGLQSAAVELATQLESDIAVDALGTEVAYALRSEADDRATSAQPRRAAAFWVRAAVLANEGIGRKVFSQDRLAKEAHDLRSHCHALIAAAGNA